MVMLYGNGGVLWFVHRKNAQLNVNGLYLYVMYFIKGDVMAQKIKLVIVVMMMFLAGCSGTRTVVDDKSNTQKVNDSVNDSQDEREEEIAENIIQGKEIANKEDLLGVCTWLKSKAYVASQDIFGSTDKDEIMPFKGNNIIDDIKNAQQNYNDARDREGISVLFGSEMLGLSLECRDFELRNYGSFSIDKEYFYFYSEISKDGYLKTGTLQRIRTDQIKNHDYEEVETISSDVLVFKAFFLESGKVIYLKKSANNENFLDLYLYDSESVLLDSDLAEFDTLYANMSGVYYAKRHYSEAGSTEYQYQLYFVDISVNADPILVDTDYGSIYSVMREHGTIPELGDNFFHYMGRFIVQENKAYYLKQSLNDCFDLYVAESGICKKIDSDIVAAKAVDDRYIYIKRNQRQFFDSKEYLDFSGIDDVTKQEKVVELINAGRMNQEHSLYEIKFGKLQPTLVHESIIIDSVVTATSKENNVYLMRSIDSEIFQGYKGKLSASDIVNNEGFDEEDEEQAWELFMAEFFIKESEKKFNISSIEEISNDFANSDEVYEFYEQFLSKFSPIMTRVDDGPVERIDVVSGGLEGILISYCDAGNGLIIWCRENDNIYKAAIENGKIKKVKRLEGLSPVRSLYDGCTEFDYIKDGDEYIYKNDKEICIGEEGCVSYRQYYKGMDLIYVGDRYISNSELYCIDKEGECQKIAGGVSCAVVIDDNSILYISFDELILYTNGTRKVIDEDVNMFWNAYEQEPLFESSDTILN